MPLVLFSTVRAASVVSREAGPALGDLASIVKAYDITGMVPQEPQEPHEPEATMAARRDEVPGVIRGTD